METYLVAKKMITSRAKFQDKWNCETKLSRGRITMQIYILIASNIFTTIYTRDAVSFKTIMLMTNVGL